MREYDGAAPWCLRPEECCGLSALLAAEGHADRYTILEEIGRGGMSDVYAAWDKRLRRRVALKVCRSPVEGEARHCLHHSEDSVLGAFAGEMHILAQLHHSSIIPLYDFGLDAGNRLFFSMPLLDGTTYLDVIEDVHSGRGGWSLVLALGPLMRICDGIRYAHAKGIVHADLKPSNIAVGSMGETYVLDWGLAQVMEPSEKRGGKSAPSSICLALYRARHEDDSSSCIAGTPAYMPREYAATGLVTRHFDIYSFGAILYHLLAGRPPFAEEGSNLAVFSALLEREPQPLADIAERPDPDLIEIIDRCMARSPEDRYASMQAVRGDLNTYLEKRIGSGRPRAKENGTLAGARHWLRNALALGVGSGD